MKKRMASLALAVLFLALAGCGSSSEAAAKLRAGITGMPGQMTIFTNAAFLDSSGQVVESAVTDWETYMSDTYKSEINLDNIRWDGELDFEGVASCGGLLHLYPGEINICLMMDSILPMEEYLADNKIWNSLPEEFRNRFVKDGHIWGIPKSTDVSIEVSSIQTSILKAVNMDTPETLEELHQVALACKASDLKGDGAEREYFYGYPYMLSEDFYSQYGLYYTAERQAIAYNPQRNRFEDCMMQQTSKDLLNYIRKLYTEGLVDPDALMLPDTLTAEINAGVFGVIQGDVTRGKFEISFNAKRAEGVTEEDLLSNYDAILQGYEALDPLSDNPVAFSDDGQCYVLSKSTKEPEAVVNAFVEMLFSSVYSYCDMSIGGSDSYKINNDVITCQYSDETTKILPPRANLVDALDLLSDKEYVVVTPEQNVELARRIQKDSAEYRNNYIERNLKNGKLVKVSAIMLVDNPIGFYWFNKEFNNVLTSLTNRHKSTEELLSVYVDTITFSEDHDNKVNALNQLYGLKSKE